MLKTIVIYDDGTVEEVDDNFHPCSADCCIVVTYDENGNIINLCNPNDI